MDGDRPSSWWRCLLKGGEDTKKFLLLLLAGVLSVQVGFVAVGAGRASWLIAFGGYYFILAVFAAFLACGLAMAREKTGSLRAFLRHPGWPGLCLVLGSLCLILVDGFGHKILWDEYVLQSTAEHMHMTKQIGTPYRGFLIEGSWVSFDIFLDKRPYFFAFLVSLLHDLSGYRPANMIVLNGLLTPVFLGLAYYFAKELSNRRGGILAVLLLSSLPILAQNASGAGMELHNLVMLLCTLCAALWYLRRPEPLRLSFLCLSTVLLSQSRYESVIFVIPGALVVLAGWRRLGRPVWSWVALLSPCLFIPYAWHNRVLSATPMLWQLNEGQDARFSTRYLPENLAGAWGFFFNSGRDLGSSWFLSGLGLLSLLGLLVFAWRRVRGGRAWAWEPTKLVFAAYAAGVAANLGLLMFYYWARLDDPVASRFSLPAYLMLVFAVVCFAAQLEKQVRHLWLGLLVALGAYLAFAGIPMLSWRLYSEYNLVAKVLAWEMDYVEHLPARSRLVVANRSNLPYMLRRIPAVAIESARKNSEKIRYHLEQGTFSEILVLQRYRPTSVGGDFGLDPDDALPPEYSLECLAEHRFGGSLHRISRVTKLDKK